LQSNCDSDSGSGSDSAFGSDPGSDSETFSHAGSDPGSGSGSCSDPGSGTDFDFDLKYIFVNCYYNHCLTRLNVMNEYFDPALHFTGNVPVLH